MCVDGIGENIDVVRADDVGQREHVSVEKGRAQGGSLRDSADEVAGI